MTAEERSQAETPAPLPVEPEAVAPIVEEPETEPEEQIEEVPEETPEEPEAVAPIEAEAKPKTTRKQGA